MGISLQTVRMDVPARPSDEQLRADWNIQHEADLTKVVNDKQAAVDSAGQIDWKLTVGGALAVGIAGAVLLMSGYKTHPHDIDGATADVTRRVIGGFVGGAVVGGAIGRVGDWKFGEAKRATNTAAATQDLHKALDELAAFRDATSIHRAS